MNDRYDRLEYNKLNYSRPPKSAWEWAIDHWLGVLLAIVILAPIVSGLIAGIGALIIYGGYLLVKFLIKAGLIILAIFAVITVLFILYKLLFSKKNIDNIIKEDITKNNKE